MEEGPMTKSQYHAQLKARRVVEMVMWIQHSARPKATGPVDRELTQVVAAWFTDRKESP